jgi:hypothetical protein
MLAIAVMLWYAAGFGAGFALVTLAALPFRLWRRTRDPVVASALAGGTLFLLAMCVNGVPDKLEPSLGFYVVAFLISVRFYGWRDDKRARSTGQVGAAVGLAGGLPDGAANGSGKLDDLRRGPEVQL